MRIELLKELIENKKIGADLLIFNAKNCPFIAKQYIREISKVRGLEIKYFNSLEEYLNNTSTLWIDDVSTYLNVVLCNTLSKLPEQIRTYKNLIINAKDVDSTLYQTFENNVVEIPKLQEWQIKDYVYSQGEGVAAAKLEQLIKQCSFDIDKLDNEIAKVAIFDEIQRPYIFQELEDAHLLDCSNVYSIFSLTNAIQSRDLNTVCDILRKLSQIDVEPLGLVTLLYNNFKKLIKVWLTPEPTEANTGLKPNQIYAIRKLPRTYTKAQLINIFKELTLLEFKLKQGILTEDILVDYTLIKIFSL